MSQKAIFNFNEFLWTKFSGFISSSGADSENVEVEKNPHDDVELEKSNVLLMGPTGSGNINFLLFEIDFKCYV